MIKKTLLGIITTTLSFIGVSFAYMDTVIDLPGNFNIGDFSNSIDKSLNFGGGVLKIVNGNPGAGNETYSNFLWNNGKLYVYSPSPIRGTIQGFISGMCKTSGDGTCSSSYSLDILNEFYSSTTPFQKLKINVTNVAGICAYNGGYTFCFNPLVGNDWSANLTGSLDIPEGTTNFTTYAGYSPFSDNSGGGTNINNIITGDYVYYDCTWNDILIALESEGYNKYVCYGGIDNFELYNPEISYNPIPGTGLSIAQIWANSSARAWDNFPDWFTFWEGLYLDSSDNNYNAMWSSYPAVYHTYFQLYNSYGGGLDPRSLLEYCQLRTLTGDSLNNSAGGYFKPVCETVIREKQTGLRDCRVNGTLYSGCELNPQVAIGTNWNGVGNMSGVVVKSDGINFIQDYFNLIKSKLQTNGFTNNFVGIIPGYIIVFLLGIILFRFISH